MNPPDQSFPDGFMPCRAQKSAWRRRMTIRWLRWAFWRRVFELIPLQARWSFPMTSVAAVLAAEKVLHDRAQFENASFDPAYHGDVLRRAERNDKMLGMAEPPRAALFRRQVAVVPDCAVLGHVGAVIGADGSLLGLHAREVPNWNRARPRRLTTRMFQHGLVTWLEGTQHYFHFFASLLPLIEFLERDHRPEKPLTVLVPANGPRFRRQVCAAIEAAYRGVRFEGLEADERAEVRSYLWLYHGSENAEWLPVDAEAGTELADLLRRHYGLKEPRGGERLFLGQRGPKQQRLINQAELEDIATAQGFQCFEAHADNHAEQVRRFGEAEIIVAVHGAGLTNLLFARPGATVLELFPEDGVKSSFLWLATRMGLNYRALLGEPGPVRQAFRIAPQRFAAGLQDALRARELAASPWRAAAPEQSAATGPAR
jgi:Glycosyltransferase 61